VGGFLFVLILNANSVLTPIAIGQERIKGISDKEGGLGARKITGLKLVKSTKGMIVSNMPDGQFRGEFFCQNCERALARGIVGMEFIRNTAIQCECGSIYRII
jgi:hypothetical protein